MTRIGLWNAASSEYTSTRYLRGVHYLPNSNRWLKVLEVKRRRDAGKSLYSGVDKDNDIVSNTAKYATAVLERRWSSSQSSHYQGFPSLPYIPQQRQDR